MRTNLILGAGRGPRLAVLELIKRSGEGLGVKELAAELGMSYMGVKAHCVALTAAGYLTTWRRPSTRGRPLMLYRLAEPGERLFAESEEELGLGILKEAAGLFGATAPQKLLVMFFRSQSAAYRERITGGGTTERALALVRLRERDGRMSSLLQGERWEIREFHNPLAALFRRYPDAAAMEEHMIGEILGVAVKRREEGGAVIFTAR